jgi:outer membrane lipoprotein-sorting protein
LFRGLALSSKKIIATGPGVWKNGCMNRLRFLPCGLRLLAVLAILPDAFTSAQDAENWTLESIVERIEEANGGRAQFERTTNVRMRGIVETGPEFHEFLLLRKRPDLMRLHLMKEGRKIEIIYNGEQAWERISFRGQERVRQVPLEELWQSGLDTDFDGPLIGEPAADTRREYLGVERINRVDHHVVVVEDSHFHSRHFIDSRTFRTLMTKVRPLSAGEDQETIIRFSQYERVDRLWVAKKVRREYPDGRVETLIIEEAELNPGILDRLFEPPSGG